MVQLGKILASVNVIKSAMIMLGGKLREGLGVGLKEERVGIHGVNQILRLEPVKMAQHAPFFTSYMCLRILSC
jgi:hypothetical protein